MKKKSTSTSRKVPNYGRILARVLAFGMLLTYLNSRAQFTIKNNLKGSSAGTDIIFGGSPAAYLTSGIDDPIDNGWLRVTKAAYQQKGYAYINKSFPSSLGVFIDFEYTSWRNAQAQYGGADGFSVFLFDAKYGPGSFELGGYGGSLGYANYKKSGESSIGGLKGGYLGVGIDEYGNFSNPTEGRVGGVGFKPNSIVLRGPTTNDSKTTNRYLSGTQLNNDRRVDYGTIVSKRPASSSFYRRVQIQIDPTSDGKYRIQVRWATSNGGAFTKLLDYVTTDAPPASMKVGFAASTGQGFNYHEIRNLMVTTPGGVRLDKQVNKTSVAVGEQLRYSVNIYNATTADLNDLILTDTLRDGAGNFLPQDAYTLDSIVFDARNNTKNVLISSTTDGATLKAHLNMGAATLDNSTEATLTAYVTVKKRPAGGIITNSAYIDASKSGITDEDLTNNYAVVSSRVISTNLSVEADHQDIFYQGDAVDEIYLNVKNNGPDATGTTTEITDTLPAGLQFVGAEGDGWVITEDNGIVKAIYNGSVDAAGVYPRLTLKVNVAEDVAGSQIHKGCVRISTDLDTADNKYIDPININRFTTGEVGNDQTISAGTVPDQLSEIMPASTTTNAPITHQWQSSMDGVNWQNIDGAINASYQPTSSLTATTYYRRLDNVSDRKQAPVPSNITTVTVKETTLAIVLKRFEGSSNNGVNLLDWTTASEVDNKGFEIYRSTDMGVHWSKVGFIESKGPSTHSTVYHYEEPAPVGLFETQYKLNVVNNDGKGVWSGIVSIRSAKDAAVKLYPNPAHDYIYIGGITGTATVFDFAGRQVLRTNITSDDQTVKVPIQNLAKGIYFVRIGGRQFKFIKQ
ncbi:T9SS type A sorting domain-containing protein [Arachidicoccus terrestris]|uniref:T9SS type A sorting domain-containing protein n=1 Tax=Arachidicoccus terrestris TaxID=2875539 RepID=UPI001CC6D19F|nr:T9SS type A sorting domain-containing protein [Arachidicoccus terrestris]UAY55144.1 DUF11 domain-containing protein [Arachidicoccus terrestris]